MSRYPGAEWVPWRYLSDSGQPTYFKGTNRPESAVLHVMQGYMSTARQWALTGHYGASWHFSVGRDGHIMQHLEFEDGGYHAGIASPPAPTPTWGLWNGSDINVNNYTIGIEHEGFSGDGFTEAQGVASRDLCRWLADTIGFAYDRDHFPPHADIDLVNRPNDFGPPAYREEHYRFMFEEDGAVTRTEYEDLLISIFSGSEEAALPREQRLANAEYRKGEIVNGNAASVNDRAASAIAVATDHAGDDALHSGDGFADHQHEPGTSGPTGGVIRGGH